jgi:hypothetical protein
MKLLQKNPLDNSPLGRERGEGAVILRVAIRSKTYSLKESREKKRERQRERDRCICLCKKTETPTLTILN